MIGGQWPQARLAQVRAWQLSAECQLCKSAPGTAAHRFVCSATRPTDGWPQPPAEAAPFLQEAPAARLAFLATRGLAVLDLPVPAANQEEALRWIIAPDDGVVVGGVWYIDGSMIDGRYAGLARVGFGVLAVAADGRILAAGFGTPPAWVRTVPGAEAWAIFVALRFSVAPSGVISDCLGAVSTVAGALCYAVSAKHPLARLWSMVRCTLAEEAVRLAWMPAHLSAKSAVSRIRSDGVAVSPQDWRGNRLVDALAKRGASVHRVPAATRLRLQAAHAACLHAGALLGVVTKVANNHQMVVVSCDGTATTVVARDSRPTPWSARGRVRLKGKAKFIAAGAPARGAAMLPIYPGGAGPGGGTRALKVVSPRCKALAAFRAAERAKEAAALQACVERRQAELLARGCAVIREPPAARFEALRRAVRERSSPLRSVDGCAG